MNVCVYPCESQSVERFRALGQQLAFRKLSFWRWDNLHCRVGDLIRSEADHYPIDYAVQRGLAGVRCDVVLIHGAVGRDVRTIMAACREWRHKPIIAVATQQSIEMPLAVLFEHLCYDRAHEEQILRK